MHRGQHLLVSVLSMNKHTNTATVTIDRNQVLKAVTRGDSFTLKQLLPGMLLNVRIEDVLENGLSVTFLTFFTATVEQNHMSLLRERGWEESYRKGMKARARIVTIDYVAKQITLSMAPHVVHLQVPQAPFSEQERGRYDGRCERDEGIGHKYKVESFGPGYVHIFNVSDKRVDKLDKKFTVGSNIKCRMLGFSPFDAVVSVSCKELLSAQTVLRHQDLKPGTKVSGKILSAEPWGILMEISEGVRGLVTPQHMTTLLLSKKANSNGKYKVGKTVSARVLHVDHEAKKTFLTMKSGLLASELPVLSSFEEATMGRIAHGFITKFAEYGLIVTFYNNVYGLVPMAVLQQAGIDNLEEAYVIGQVVKARVTRCDVGKKRLMLSFDTTSNSLGNKPITAPDSATKLVGTTITNVKITNVESTCFRLQTNDGMEGVLPFVQLTDFPRNTLLVDKVVKRFSAGDIIAEPLLVVSEESDGVLTLSKKPLLLAFASHNAILPRTFEDVQENAVLIGYPPKEFLKEQFVARIEEVMFEIGETVTCCIEKVDKENKQFIVGFQQRKFVQSTNSTNKVRPAFFQAYLCEQACVRNAATVTKTSFYLGKTEKAEFVGVRPYGAVFALERDDETVTVLVPTVTTETNEWNEGDTAKLLLTDYDFSKNVYYGTDDELLVKNGLKRSRKQKQRIKAGEKIDATVLVVGSTENYVVVSFPDPHNSDLLQFGVVELCDFLSGSNSTPFNDLVLLALEEEKLVAKLKNVSHKLLAKLPKYTQADLVLGNTLTGIIAGISENSMRFAWRQARRRSVEGRVIAVTVKGANKHKAVSEENPAKFHDLQLSLRTEDLAGDEKVNDVQRFARPDWLKGSAGRALLKEGNFVHGVVLEQSMDHLIVKLSSNVTGTLSCIEVSDDVKVVRAFQDEFPVGKRIKCFVLQVNDNKKVVDLSMIRSARDKTGIKPGSIVNGVISTKKSAIRPPSIMVQLGTYSFGRVCITELLAEWENKMLELAQFGAARVVRCVVLSTTSSHIDLSLRSDALENPSEYATKTSKPVERNIGDLVPGIVATTTTSGCFVRLDRHTTARVMLRDLSDDFVKDPQTGFPVGKLVAGRVTKKSVRGLELSLKTSVVSEDVSMLKWNDLKEGLTIKGTITKVQAYGVFVRIEKSTISGLCHISEIADEKVMQPLDQIFSQGDYVKAKVLKVENRRVSFGLKPSYFADEESSSDDESDEEEEEDEDLDEEEAERMEVDEEEAFFKKSKSVAMESGLGDDKLLSKDEDESCVAPVEFSWDGFSSALSNKTELKDDGASSSDEEDDGEKDNLSSSKVGKQKRLQSDEWVALREKALAINEEIPQNASDYERLLVDLYARAEEHEDVKQTLTTMQKKFHTSKQAWIRSLQYLVGEKQFSDAAETLQRSLKSLAAHKHLPVILKYGQLLYEQAELDKARTIFEGILANYPKRIDLWNVYLDKEIKFGDIVLVRALFERLLAMEFSAKKMKFLFKKFLQFEQEQGDNDCVEHVKHLAKEFVASAAAK
ncbi:unnamed protein product [Peronospora belbahrii]|uniref:S1 motif domain-containing protein n=1 Tax=Peronospora belbahrii TaxID=622444 RepID=A0AAU9L5C6_9STRA|nr:unnamed protein product [Peronospora belbahrii]